MAKGTGLNLDESQVADSGAIRDSERFSIKRNAVSVTCTIAVAGGEDDVFQGTLEDISSTGLSMSTHYPVEKDATLEFAFDVDGSTEVREGKIMWVRLMGPIYKAGARFSDGDLKSQELHLAEGVNFPCEYKLNASHVATATVIAINNSNITFVTNEIFSLGTMLEILVDPWEERAKGEFNISFVDISKMSDEWRLWDLHKVAKVGKAKQIRPGECHITANFVADKRR